MSALNTEKCRNDSCPCPFSHCTLFPGVTPCQSVWLDSAGEVFSARIKSRPRLNHYFLPVHPSPPISGSESSWGWGWGWWRGNSHTNPPANLPQLYPPPIWDYPIGGSISSGARVSLCVCSKGWGPDTQDSWSFTPLLSRTPVKAIRKSSYRQVSSQPPSSHYRRGRIGVTASRNSYARH